MSAAELFPVIVAAIAALNIAASVAVIVTVSSN